MSKSTQIQSRITEIAHELANGAQREDILRKYANKWQIAERTIDRYLTNARQQADELLKKRNEAALETMEDEVKEAIKIGLKPVIEIDMLLQEIAFNSFKLIRGNDNSIVKVENTTADKLKAIDLLYKRLGLYPAIKSKVELEGGTFLDFLKQAQQKND